MSAIAREFNMVLWRCCKCKARCVCWGMGLALLSSADRRITLCKTTAVTWTMWYKVHHKRDSRLVAASSVFTAGVHL